MLPREMPGASDFDWVVLTSSKNGLPVASKQNSSSGGPRRHRSVR